MSLGKYLELILEKTQQSRSIPGQYESLVTGSVAKIILSIQDQLDMSVQVYESLFFSTLFFPFKYGTGYSPMVLKQLSLNDIKYLSLEINAKVEEFFEVKSTSLCRIQTYLFLMAVEVYFDQRLDITPEAVQAHLKYMEAKIGAELNYHLADTLKRHLLNGYTCMKEKDLEDLKVDLSTLVITQSSGHHVSGCSLDDILTQCKGLLVNVDKEKYNIEIETWNPNQSPSHEPPCNVDKMLQVLDLKKYYPQKLSLREALRLRPELLKKVQCTESKELYMYLIHKIMSCDFRCRSSLLYSSAEEKVQTAAAKDELFDDDSDGCSEDDENIKIHPMDLLLSLIHCADDFLRQDLFVKLVDCQLSVPILLPDLITKQLTLPLWAMRSIVKEWKCKHKTGEVAHECSLVTYKAPIVSFVRFSKQDKSKSKIMNEVISDSKHDYFFHRDCEGGTSKRLLGEGLVDMCWYLPTGKDEDIFPDAIAFLNLHGDARSNPHQINFIRKMSFLTFALFKGEDLDQKSTEVLKELSAAAGGVVMLMCGSETSQKVKQLNQAIPNKLSGLKLFKRNADQTKKKIRDIINQKLGEHWVYTAAKPTIEQYSELKDKHVVIDESSSDFLKGQIMAKSAVKIVTDYTLCQKMASSLRDLLSKKGESIQEVELAMALREVMSDPHKKTVLQKCLPHQLTQCQRFIEALKKIWSDSECTHSSEIASKFLQMLSEDVDTENLKVLEKLLPVVSDHAKHSVKEKLLPLQGPNLWQEWTKNDKEEYRQRKRGGMTIESYSGVQQKIKRSIRKQQLVYVKNLTPLMKTFLKYLFSSQGSVRKYFLKCLSIHLDEISRDSMSLLQTRYKVERQKLQKLQSKKEENIDAVQSCKKDA